MIQLQSRINPAIGETLQAKHAWQVDDEATIVTKSMKSDARKSQPHAGERAYRIVDTKKNPEQAAK